MTVLCMLQNSTFRLYTDMIYIIELMTSVLYATTINIKIGCCAVHCTHTLNQSCWRWNSWQDTNFRQPTWYRIWCHCPSQQSAVTRTLARHAALPTPFVCPRHLLQAFVVHWGDCEIIAPYIYKPPSSLGIGKPKKRNTPLHLADAVQRGTQQYSEDFFSCFWKRSVLNRFGFRSMFCFVFPSLYFLLLS